MTNEEKMIYTCDMPCVALFNFFWGSVPTVEQTLRYNCNLHANCNLCAKGVLLWKVSSGKKHFTFRKIRLQFITVALRLQIFKNPRKVTRWEQNKTCLSQIWQLNQDKPDRDCWKTVISSHPTELLQNEFCINQCRCSVLVLPGLCGMLHHFSWWWEMQNQHWSSVLQIRYSLSALATST